MTYVIRTTGSGEPNIKTYDSYESAKEAFERRKQEVLDHLADNSNYNELISVKEDEIRYRRFYGLIPYGFSHISTDMPNVSACIVTVELVDWHFYHKFDSPSIVL